jgi:DNA repair protein RadA/Sms
LVEEPVASAGPARGAVPRHSIPEPLEALGVDAEPLMPTGVAELDRVLGGGLVPGSVTLIGGEPGIGKSTLVLQAVAGLAGTGRRCLLVAAEESPGQVRRRATRLGATAPGVWMVAETSMPGVRAAVTEVSPDVLVIDSIQTVWDPDLESVPGSMAQVRGCAQQLAALAKAGGPAVVLLGHVTKDGALAGPRLLEHLVDTVLSFEGDRHHALRLLRALKHRFGATGELGVFEMTAGGLVEVDDAGRMFLADRCGDGPGSVVFAAMDGHRPLLVEIQALVASNPAGSPRRSASGFDPSRLAMLLAVLDRRAGLRLGGHEVYVSVVGGVKLSDPGADLAVCLAVASSATHQPVDPDTVVVGEVGLGGEIRQVADTVRRLGEAARLGFDRAVVPAHAPPHPGLCTAPVGNLAEALDRHLGRASSLPRLRVVR